MIYLDGNSLARCPNKLDPESNKSYKMREAANLFKVGTQRVGSTC
jgi:hypothetical protein